MKKKKKTKCPMILYAIVYATELELMLNMKFEYLGGYFFKFISEATDLTFHQNSESQIIFNLFTKAEENNVF